jgi:phospholipase/lecithinase/hemolysin
MKRAFVLVVLVLLISPLRSLADSFSQLVVFGDSLSDTGNLYIATKGANPAQPGYSSGLFTDGPNSDPSTNSPLGVWDQQLATMLGLPSPAPVLAGHGGTNYAFGGALTGTDPNYANGTGVPYVEDQVGLYLATHSNTASASALYTFWAGANDIFDSPTPQTAQTAVANLEASINALYADGGRDFLWLNMPPLGSTPDGLNSGASAYLNQLSKLYNADWLGAIGSLDSHDPGIDITGVNVYGLTESFLSDPSKYGFTNLDTPAQGQNVNPNDYLFWDGVHPTTVGHYWVANLAYKDLTAPEPPTALLLGSALLAGAFWMKRRARVEP